MSTEYYEGETITSQNIKDFKFSGSEFLDCEFIGLDLAEFDLSRVKLIECLFEKCNLSNIKLDYATVRDVMVKDSKAMEINYSTTQAVVDLNFEKSQIDYSIFNGLKLKGCTFQECNIKNCDFSEADLSKANFEDSNLEESSFNNADCSGASFLNAKNYFIDMNFTKLKKAKFSFPEAITLLESQEILIER